MTNMGTSNFTVEHQLDICVIDLEKELDADCLAFIGPIFYGADDVIRDAIEERTDKKRKLAFFLETQGGYIEVVQRIVDTLRKHYQIVDFYVPNVAMSAGTVLVMAGDSIHMDYYSRLGPIDPQSQRPNGEMVPALGYLIQYERLIKKAQKGTLTTAELTYLVQRFDPAELYTYEQSRELSITLLKEWLVRYKFKNWEKGGKPVSKLVRTKKAAAIARLLNNTEHWHSHGRGISMEVLRRDVGLEIEDFGSSPLRHQQIRTYYRLLVDYRMRRGHGAGVLHWRGHYTPLSE